MNVCMTHYAFYPTTGGVESHLLDLCAELVRQGHEVHALVGSLEGQPDHDEIEDVDVYRHDLFNPELVREQKKKNGFAAETVWPELQAEIREYYRTFVKDHGCHLVHAHNFHHFLPEYGLALTDLHREGLPTFLTVHEVWSEFICEDLLNRTEWDSVITVSRHVEEGIRGQAAHLDNLRLVYHGIDTTLFSPGNNDPKWADRLGLWERPTIIHPARMLPWKGVIYSVEAMDILRRKFPDALLIITDTEDIVDWIDELRGYKEQVIQAIQDKGLTENVVTQPFSYLELPWVYNYCDVVVYPTIGEEPFGLVPVEAMACARPAVVSRSGGLIESVIDGVTGFIIEKRNAEALAEKLALLLEDEDLARAMGAAGRQRAVEMFTRERMAREVVALYEAGVLTTAGRRSS
jgi:glycosyltransferase involved in cell wall biosynthesis